MLATVRHLAFRADGNGIRLGVRTSRKRPRQRQAHLWWADVQQISIVPRRYGSLVEITLGPAARITRRRGLAHQVLLLAGMLVLPVSLGRGAPRLTEPRATDPQYRVRVCDMTPEEAGPGAGAARAARGGHRGDVVAAQPADGAPPAAGRSAGGLTAAIRREGDRRIIAHVPGWSRIRAELAASVFVTPCS